MTYIVIGIVVIVVFLIYNTSKGGQDIKHVEKSGGIENKYMALIKYLMSNEKLQLRRINSNNIKIGYGFAGDGFIQFTLTEMSGNLMVRYTSKDNISGVQNLGWKFNEHTDQYEMFNQISKDLAVHNFMLSGMSREEAIRAVKDITG